MTTRTIEYSGQFQKDVKKAQKRHKDMSKLKALMTLLINDALPLPQVYKDHPLQGNYKGYRDAHIEPDWLLIYKITDEVLRFERTGTHSDLFWWIGNHYEQVLWRVVEVSRGSRKNLKRWIETFPDNQTP